MYRGKKSASAREGKRLSIFSLKKRISVFLIVRNFAQYFAGNACGDNIGGNVFRHDASRADNGIIADRHARENDGACPDPDIISDRDGFGDFHTRLPQLRMQGVFRGRKDTIGGNKNMIAETDSASVLNGKIVIGEEKVPDFDGIAVITPERRNDGDFFARFSS